MTMGLAGTSSNQPRRVVRTLEIATATSSLALSHSFPNAAQMRAILYAYKKLRTSAVGIHCARHRKHAQGVLDGIVHAVGGELALDAVRIFLTQILVHAAALDHKSRNHAVKDQPVVKTALCQLDKVAHRDRRDVLIQLRSHLRAVFELDDRLHCSSSVCSIAGCLSAYIDAAPSWISLHIAPIAALS